MFIWASMYIGVLVLLLPDIDSASLSYAFFKVREFRVMALTLIGLSAAYATFGVLILRYRATRIQRLVVLFGPALLAILFTIDALMSTDIAEPFQDMKMEMLASSVVSVALPWLLAIMAYRVVSKNNQRDARPNSAS